MVKFIAKNDGFVCGHCQKEVGPIIYGGSYRNHCPFCLWSKHVDSDIPGDRANSCMGLMSPMGVMTRRTGEYVLAHKCVKCGFERLNRIAGDDDEKVLIKISGMQIR